jgi:hypothetical protein
MKQGRIPIKHGHCPIKHGHFPIEHGHSLINQVLCKATMTGMTPEEAVAAVFQSKIAKIGVQSMVSTPARPPSPHPASPPVNSRHHITFTPPPPRFSPW